MADTNGELIEFARNAQFFQGDIISLSNMLPASQDDLISIMEQLMDEFEAEAFSNLWLAAHWAKREIPGGLLARGTGFLVNIVIINSTAPLCAEIESEEKGNCGETTNALLAAVDSGKLGNARELIALTNAIRCWKIACGEDKPLPDKIGLEARKRAREYAGLFRGSDEAFAQESFLNVLAHLLDDEHIKADLREKQIPVDEKLATISMSNMVEIRLDKLVPERKPERVISGYQVRRAVPKIGRNDPCHCGSGKKYKKCCFAEDQKKLSRSSEVEGITIDELDEQKEERLTPRQVMDMRPYELMRLDPSRFSEGILMPVSSRLMVFDELDHVFTIYDANPHKDSEKWKSIFTDLLYYSSEHKRNDLIDRILEIYPELEFEWALGIKFTRAAGDPAGLVAVVESECERVLLLEEEEKNNSEPRELNVFGKPVTLQSSIDWLSLAYSLLKSECPFLGISFARSVLPIAGNETECLLELIESTRDSLGLDPVDLSEEISQLCDDFDSKKWMEDLENRRGEQYSQKLVDQTRKMEAKEQQYRELKASLAESRKETARIEQQANEKLAALQKENKPSDKKPDDSGDNEGIRELRDRISQLKSEVKRKHNQRNDLRRELRTTRSELQEQSQSGEPTPETWDEAGEEHMLESESYSPNTTPRVPVFPGNFIEDKKVLPAHVVSTAIKLVGRLASGDESAYQGTRRLKSKRELLRQKVGSSFRLIFRIEGSELIVVDLINRRDLEKWLS